ncbi:inactive phospholipase D5-like isoform X4 [Syngnathoides biaculeatus]|uniref:inactive phospholipase D5-like isoform X4 n=1 Tax=Syngnathoides biaculeatus TaxID=300417 RepID=UPI002ADE03B6|nr:inactive phospholipase D5-like isoform X4 [Syngnathoides biaculeatus]
MHHAQELPRRREPRRHESAVRSGRRTSNCEHGPTRSQRAGGQPGTEGFQVRDSGCRDPGQQRHFGRAAAGLLGQRLAPQEGQTGTFSAEVHRGLCPAVLLRRAGGAHLLGSGHLGVVLVENIPEDVAFTNSTASHLPLSSGLFGLLDRASRVVEIVSPRWLLNSTEYESNFHPATKQGRLLLSRLLALKSRKIQLKISSGIVDSAELKTLARHGAEVHYLNMTALTKGHLHSSFWVVDRRHFYIGSGSMDWRSLATKKELGVMVYNCSCLALDLHRVFNVYWGLQYKDFIPSFWSKRLFAFFNKDSPLELTLNSTKAQAYVTTSPDVFIPKDRSSDLEAISRVIKDARHFVYISITDYLPLLNTSAYRYWSRIDGLIREALILRRVRVRLLISCRENTHPLTFNFVWSLRSLCMEETNCSLEAKFFNPRLQRDGNLQGINHNRFMVTWTGWGMSSPTMQA